MDSRPLSSPRFSPAFAAILLLEERRLSRFHAHIILKLRAIFGKVKFVLGRPVCVAVASLLNLRCLRFTVVDKEERGWDSRYVHYVPTHEICVFLYKRKPLPFLHKLTRARIFAALHRLMAALKHILPAEHGINH